MTLLFAKPCGRLVRLSILVIGFAIFGRANAGDLFFVTRANSLYPHVACVLKYDDGTHEWLHFRAQNLKNKKVLKKVLKFKKVPGEVVAEKFENARVNHYLWFKVDDKLLRKAKAAALNKFADSKYKLTDNDCVSLGIYVARTCGLKTKKDNSLPVVFFNVLSFLNRKIRIDVQKNRDRVKGFVPPWLSKKGGQTK